MPTSHHNTTHESGDCLAGMERQASTQEIAILTFFRANNHRDGWTPSEVFRRIDLNCPLTSIRRAMSNLTRAGQLVRTGIKRPGMYGRPEYAWRRPGPEQTSLF